MQIQSLAKTALTVAAGVGIALACGATAGVVGIVALAIIGLSAAYHGYKNYSCSTNRNIEQQSQGSKLILQGDGSFKTREQLRIDRLLNH